MEEVNCYIPKMETVKSFQVYVTDMKTLLVPSVFPTLLNTVLHRGLYFNKPPIMFLKKSFLE